LICQAIIASKTSNPHIYIFTNKDIGLNYATLFVPPIFIMFFAIFMTFTLRPFIIKRDGLISLIIVLLVFLTYQLYPIIFLITNTDSSKNSDLKISCLLLPSLVFGIGAIATMLSTSIVYKNLYVKV
jgi:hypothetical protein